MGIVIKQSIQNTLLTFVGFGVGALNTLYLYVHFLGDQYYGLTAFLLSSANLLMPFFTFGVQNTLVKFYQTYTSEQQKSQFLNLMLVLPFLVILPLLLIFAVFQDTLIDLLSSKNAIIHNFVWFIPVIGILMAYFEIGYAWVKVHLKSVWGNFLKEVGLRVIISGLLLSIHWGFLEPHQFVYGLVCAYGVITLIMGIMAYNIRKPQLRLMFPAQRKEVIRYTAFIVFSASIGILLLDIDKFMIGQYIPIDQVAFYAVAGFMALTIAVPMRAMHQITHPITTQFMAQRKWRELQELYQKTSITLQVVAGWIMLGILSNLDSIYAFLPDSYSIAIGVVFLLSVSKYFDAMLGNNNSIIFNSKYYQTVLILGFVLLLVAISLNWLLIPLYGIQGVAWATFISMAFYNLSKLYFVVFKMKLYPFTPKTFYSLMITAGLWLILYAIEFKIHPILSILIKSSILTVLYFGLHYYFKISLDLNQIIQKVFKIKKPRA